MSVYAIRGGFVARYVIIILAPALWRYCRCHADYDVILRRVASRKSAACYDMLQDSNARARCCLRRHAAFAPDATPAPLGARLLLPPSAIDLRDARHLRFDAADFLR